MSLEREYFYDVLRNTDTPIEVVALQIIKYLQRLGREGFSRGADKHGMGKRSWLNSVTEVQRIEESGRKLMAAFGWLEVNGLIAEEPSGLHGDRMHVYDLTPQGQAIQSELDMEEFRRRVNCRKETLHARVTDKCWAAFMSGDYSTSIFAAFKELEVAVRAVGEFAETDIGVDLMKKAFRPGGKLASTTEPTGEQVALATLFEGAVGRFRNPSAHRHMEIDSPEEAYEMLAFASHLMRVVEDRSS